MKTRFFRNISMATIALLLLLAPIATVWAQPPAPDVHVGEDGVQYPLARGIIRGGSLATKVEPLLVKEATDSDFIDVLIFLKSADLNTLATVQKRAFTEKLETLSAEIQFIERKYLPAESLPPNREHEAYRELRSTITGKDTQRLKELHQNMDATMDAMRRDVGSAIGDAIHADQKEFSAFIEALGGTVLNRTTSMNILSAYLPSKALETVAQASMVTAIEKNRRTEYELDISMDSSGFDSWWSKPFDGGAYDFGLVDTGVEEDHPAFSNITFYSRPGSSILGDHGTHVTGIAASNDATYKGGAYGLDAVIWANAGLGANTAERQAGTMESMDWLAASAAQGPEVVNHSLGYGTASDTDYSSSDSFYDAYVSHFDIMVTKSAGNGYWNNTTPTITHPASAYNLMAVANMNDMNTLTRTDDVRSSSSSIGPTVGNRKKPDICAPGTSILSANSNYMNGDDFIPKSGTSMAAPHIAAAIVLMEDAGNHIPMAQKAVLINTADAWSCNNTSTTTDDALVQGSYWDKSYGWGYLDMHEAEFNRTDTFSSSMVARNDTATADDYKLYKGRMYKHDTMIEKATLVWEKRTNYVSGEPPSTTYSLSDLNLRLYDEATGALLDSDMGGADNVHQVDVSAGSEGWNDVVIKAYAWSTSFGGVTAEPFALATEENFTEATPPSFHRTYSRPNYVGPHQTFNTTVYMYNNGEVTAHTNTLTLDNITGATVDIDNSQSLPPILPGPYPDNPQTASFSITTSGLTQGTYWLPLHLTSECYIETYTYDVSNGISFNVETTPPESTCTAPAQSSTSPIPVAWNASDPLTGVKRSYLYVKRPGATTYAYTGLSAAGTSGTLTYIPTSGAGSYAFAIRSVDNGGNWEAIPTSAEATTTYTP